MPRPYTIPIWKKSPFIRLLLPLIAGIILQWYFQINVTVIAAALVSFGIASVLFLLLPIALRFKLQALQGLIVQLLFIALGLLVTWQKDIRHDSNWYGNYYRDGNYLVVRIDEPLAEKAKSLGLKPLARIISYADAQQAPEWFSTTPSKALPLAVSKAGLKMSDLEYIEINEAFSAVALANNKIMNLDPARVNVNGGAVALGHPLGCSGARIIVTLINVLGQRKAKIGGAGICNGGGGASAMVIENIN